MTALAALPQNMRFDDCDGCRARFGTHVPPLVATISKAEHSLTIGVCAACALAMVGDDQAKAAELSDRVEATARLRPNRMEVPR